MNVSRTLSLQLATRFGRALAVGLAAASALWLAGPAAAQEATNTTAERQALSRAEVLADLRLWQQAGVDRHADLATYYQLDVAAYERALGEYRRLRASPAYAAEVNKALAQTHDGAIRTAAQSVTP